MNKKITKKFQRFAGQAKISAVCRTSFATNQIFSVTKKVNSITNQTSCVTEKVNFVTDKTFSLTDKTISVTEKVNSVMNQTFSLTDLTFSLTDGTNWVTEKVNSMTGKTFSATDGTNSMTEKGTFAPKNSAGQPVLDLIFLGMGEDGHVASLFPGKTEGTIPTDIFCAVKNSPRPPPDRVTLSYAAIGAAKNVWGRFGRGQGNGVARIAFAVGKNSAGKSHPIAPADENFTDFSLG